MVHPLIRDLIQDCNLNFLIGSGLSMPYLSTLGNIEVLLTELEQDNATYEQKNLVRISLYKKFFESALAGNLDILTGNSDCAEVQRDYRNFLAEINNILLRRKSTILSKEVNLFTTNVDIFLECALDQLSLEVNDGFNGRFLPRFSLSNFNTSRYKKSLHFENVAELPIFNLLKLHGSLSWSIDPKGDIVFSRDLELVRRTQSLLTPAVNAIAVEEGSTVPQLLAQAQSTNPSLEAIEFMSAYERLPIVNPTKDKFRHTTLNQTYYELLRIYSNELEKENTVLFALGFSFSDEHIREITLRSLNSNPTLMLLIFAYNKAAKAEIESHFPSHLIKNRNLCIVEPPEEKVEGSEEFRPKYHHTLRELNQHVFSNVLPPIPHDGPANSSQG